MSQYFYEDQVYTIDKKGNVKFGLVVENEVGFLRKFKIFLPLFRNNQFSVISLFIDKTDSILC